MRLLTFLFALCVAAVPFINGFTLPTTGLCRISKTSPCLALSSDSASPEEDALFMKKLNKRSEEIEIELSRKKLEDANTQSFLRRKPRKLKYEQARLWVQMNLGPATEEEFNDLVENGNLRTPYIPKRPEEYYTGTREWISWHHFLTHDDQRPSAVAPKAGVFD